MKGLFILASFVVAGGAFAFWMAGALLPNGETTRRGLVAAGQQSLGRAIRAVGYVEPVSEVRKLTFKIDGVIDNSPVQVGQTVNAGDVLATLKNNDDKASVAVSEQELALAKADREKLLSGIHPAQVEAAQRRVAKLEDHLKYCQQRYDRESKLYDQKVNTKEQIDQVTSELSEAKEEFKEAQAELTHLQTFVRKEDQTMAEARVRLADANLAAAKERFEDTILTAPIAGTVLEIMKREGEAVRNFDPTPVVVFADLSHLRVRAEIDERYVKDVSVGQDALIYGRGLGDQRLKGKVVLVKTLMGNKTVFTRESAERKDLEVLQVFIESTQQLNVPVGLKVDVELRTESQSAAKAEPKAPPSS